MGVAPSKSLNSLVGHWGCLATSVALNTQDLFNRSFFRYTT